MFLRFHSPTTRVTVNKTGSKYTYETLLNDLARRGLDDLLNERGDQEETVRREGIDTLAMIEPDLASKLLFEDGGGDVNEFRRRFYAVDFIVTLGRDTVEGAVEKVLEDTPEWVWEVS